MFQRLLSIIRKNKDILVYIFFGVLTTAVNYAVYFPLYNLTAFSATLCNCIAWFAAVIFAFLTNKPFVFHSSDWSINAVIPEFLKFCSCRLASGAAESIVVLITVDLLSWNGNIWKIMTSIFVVVFNYFGSKLFVFRKK